MGVVTSWTVVLGLLDFSFPMLVNTSKFPDGLKEEFDDILNLFCIESHKQHLQSLHTDTEIFWCLYI